MTSPHPNADSPRNVTRYLGQNYQFVPSYIRTRDPTTNDLRDPKNQGYYPVTATWVNRTNQNLWALVKVANNIATWILLSGSSGPLLNITVPLGTSPIIPDGTGTINFTSSGTTIQITGSSVSPNNHTINFDTSASGTVSEVTGDDGIPVLPTAGNINFFGQVVNNSTNPKPLYSKNTAVSTETYQIQKSVETATTNNDNLAGIASFDTRYFNVNTNAWITSKISQLPGSTNLGIGYSGSTFTVEGSNGSALSATNPAYVTLQSTTPGLLVTVAVTANQTFTDGAAGTIDTWRGGVSPTDAQGGVSSSWNQDMPFFLYAVLKSDQSAINFMFSRDPRATTSPIAAQISKTGTILNVGQGDFFSLGNITITDYAANPCLCIGSFRMRNVVNAGTIRYTVQTLNNTDGIAKFQLGTTFTLPTGVNGSLAGTYFQATVAGTIPTFAAPTVVYRINMQGQVWSSCNLVTVNNVPAGAQDSQLTLPYACSSTTGHNDVIGFYNVAAATSINIMLGTLNGTQSYISGIYFNAGTTPIKNATYAANDTICWKEVYQAY